MTPMGCARMMMQIATPPARVQSVRTAPGMAAFQRICGRLRMWQKCSIAVPLPIGLREKRG